MIMVMRKSDNDMLKLILREMIATHIMIKITSTKNTIFMSDEIVSTHVKNTKESNQDPTSS